MPTSTHIPVFYKKNESSQKVLIYFHGNAEDVILSVGIIDAISLYCEASVIGMEYPGYSVYKKRQNGGPSEDKIKEDAEYLYKFCLQDMGIQEKDIIVFGRSMGSGPACWLAG